MFLRGTIWQASSPVKSVRQMSILLPPLSLRMSRHEVLQYLPLAWLTAPVLHVLFSLFVGWHDYMPFPIYIPSVVEWARHSAV